MAKEDSKWGLLALTILRSLQAVGLISARSPLELPVLKPTGLNTDVLPFYFLMFLFGKKKILSEFKQKIILLQMHNKSEFAINYNTHTHTENLRKENLSWVNPQINQ